VTLLGDVDTSVPASPGPIRVEHVTTSAHVTKGGLTGSVGSSSRNTRNTSYSATGTPRLGGSLHTSPATDSVSLTLVLGHIGVNFTDQVGTKGSSEYGRKREGFSISLSSVIKLINRNGGSSGGHI
jgi:hypothetical protein